jgi:glucose/arabinose dehydrogenase
MWPRRVALLAAAAVIAAGCGGSTSSPAASDTLVAIGAGLRGPAGLRATVYAKAPANVAAFASDDQGRLWLATADYADAGRDGIYVIPAPGADAVAVVTGLHTPLGLVWDGASLYASSKAGVDAYSDFDGVHFANHRTVLTLPDGVGESNGLAVAPDGRLTMGISAPCDSCTPTSPWSAAVVSFLPDGGDLRVEAGGIRAPVGLAYVPGTSDLFVTMNQRDNLGDQTPGDWLAVVRQGQAWGFPDCFGQAGAACAGVPKPTAVLDKHAAVSGLAIVTGGLGPAVGTSALVAEWATGKVQRAALARQGADWTATVSPFLTGVKSPVALLVAHQSTLLVGDWSTGTVYAVSPA